MSTLIVTGGSVCKKAAASYLETRSFQHVIAVDAGARAAKELGLAPDYLVGDFDTLGEDALKAWEKLEGVTIRRYCPEKDDTDTEIALKLAVELEGGGSEPAAGRRNFFPEQIVLLGATGTRLDHTLANIFMLEQLEAAGISACIVDANNRISVHDAGFSFGRKELYGKYVSFLALTPQVSELTLGGFYYPLKHHTLSQSSSLCVSNEPAAERLQVEFSSGRLLMIEASD